MAIQHHTKFNITIFETIIQNIVRAKEKIVRKKGPTWPVYLANCSDFKRNVSKVQFRIFTDSTTMNTALPSAVNSFFIRTVVIYLLQGNKKLFL